MRNSNRPHRKRHTSSPSISENSAKKISVGRFTEHDIADIKGKKVLGVLNFEPRKIGNTVSEVLILGVQFPRAESGEATFITPLAQDAKIGGKLF